MPRRRAAERCSRTLANASIYPIDTLSARFIPRNKRPIVAVSTRRWHSSVGSTRCFTVDRRRVCGFAGLPCSPGNAGGGNGPCRRTTGVGRTFCMRRIIERNQYYEETSSSGRSRHVDARSRRMWRRWVQQFIAFCSSNAPPPAGAITINVVRENGNQSFSPNPATVPTGQTVVWHNVDTTTHRVVLDDGKLDLGNLGPGAFSEPMTLGAPTPYHCSIHPDMVGSLVNQ